METKIIKTSYSALDTFKQCPLKYKFQVIEKIKAPKSKEAVFGNKIHSALEYFHKKQPASPTLDELLDFIKQNWDSTIFQNEQEDMIYFSEAIKILKNYYEHYLKIKDNFTVLDTETRFEVLLESPKDKEQKCLLAGIIDRIDKTKTGIEIVDYKTAKRLPSQEDADNSLQFSLYCLGTINRWPQFLNYGLKNIKLTFYYLKHQETLSTTRTKEQLDRIQEQVWEKLAQIEKSEFQPMPSALCDYCGYKKICPMWKHLYRKQMTIDDQQIKNVIDEFFNLKQINNQNAKKIDELKEIIESYLNKEKIERVFGDTGYITRTSLIRYEYDMDKVKEILEPIGKWQNILSIDANKLKILLKSLPYPIKKEIEKTKKINKEYKMLKASAKKINKGDF